MRKRLNYRECRNKVFVLLEEKSMLTKAEIWNVIDLGDNMDYMNDYLRFHAFLNQTRKFTYQEYFKAKNLLRPVSNIIFFRDIMNRDKGDQDGFIRFCETERIPLLYYIPQIKKYIFPTGILFSLIANKLFLIQKKKFLYSLKTMEFFRGWSSANDVIDYLKEKIFREVESTGVQYLFAILREDYHCGETREQMIHRLEYKKQLNALNQEIEKNLYTLADLELIEE